MNFMDVLNTAANEIEKPLLLPVGTYHWKVTGPHTQNLNGDGTWNMINIPVTAFDVDSDADDIDQDALAEYGAVTQGRARVTFMFSTDPAKSADNQKAAYNLKNFLVDVLQIDAPEGSTVLELLNLAGGYEFKAQCVHSTNKKTGDVNIEVKNYMPISG